MRCMWVTLSVVMVSSPVVAQLAVPNEAGVSFAHVHLSVADIELHKRLWTDLLDGQLVEKAGYAAVRIPGALIFFTDRAPTAPTVGTSVNHVGFKVRDLGAVLAEWQSNGYEVDTEFVGGEGLRQAYITMPNGTRVELTGDPELTTNTEMHHVHFYAPRYREVWAWYQEIFGGTARARGTIETTVDLPGTNLSFSASEGEVAATQGAAVDHIGFEVENIEAFAGFLESKGVQFQVEPFFVESLGIWVGFFIDPAGTRVEVSQGLDRY